MTELNNRPAGGFNPLVPELAVFDLPRSLAFWCTGLGFRVAYQRPEEGFAYLERGGAQIMLSVVNPKWVAAPYEVPLGRGINFQIGVDSIAPILTALEQLDSPLFHAPHEAWHRVGATELGDIQFTAQDPNGYLIRFSQSLGERPVGA
ncbi:bleomycin resistance protein [Deinococcus ruber]|uniref:Bleomycin resistance protein n=1 Tax=Deinococcus ruber TaxID=1848197 RepID=A0A918CAQ6_9DEIO|nr:VOC family protein [Deinococcus ruber]GGR11948.1 aldoketomutase [Deinococcus ruber]